MTFPLAARAAGEFATGVYDKERDRLNELQAYSTRLESYVRHNSFQRHLRDAVGDGSMLFRNMRGKNRASRFEDRKELISKGSAALANFQTFLKKRFGNSFRAWTYLDVSKNMVLGETEFLRACKTIGYQCEAGQMKVLWRYLDRDTSGTLTILELDAEVAKELGIFKSWAERTFGNGVKRWFDAFDVNGSGQVSRVQFRKSCAHGGYPGDATHLFHLLDIDTLGILTVDRMIFFDRWHPPDYLFCEPDEESL